MSVGDSIEVYSGRQVNRRDAMERWETRDPKSATQQLTYLGHDSPMVAEWDASNAVKFGYMANVIAYRCVQIIANYAASLPIRWYPDLSDRTIWNPRANGAALLGPAGRPNPVTSSRKLVAWSFAQWMVTGRLGWEIEEEIGSDAIAGFWPLISANLQTVATESGAQWWRLFKYGRIDRQVVLQPHQVFYAWTPSQDDFRQPESPLNASRYDLSMAVMQDRYSIAFLQNGAVPASLIITAEPPTREAKDRFEQRWASDFMGPDNAGRTRFQYVDPEKISADTDLSKLVDVKILGVTQKDAQFAAEHKAHLENIAIGLGVPWSKLDASGRTYDNAGHEDLTFHEQTMADKLCAFEDEFNLQVAPRLGPEFLGFDTSGVRALQTPKSYTVGDALAMAKIPNTVTQNEIRAAADLPPIDGGDQLIEVDMAEAPAAPLSQSKELNPEPDPYAGASQRLLQLATRALEQTNPQAVPDEPPVQVQPRDAAQIRRERVWRAHDATATAMENRWARTMRRLFKAQAESVDRRLTGKRGAKIERRADPAAPVDPAVIFDTGYWRERTLEMISDLFESVTSAGLARVAEKFGVGFDPEDPTVIRFIQARANQLAGQVTETTYQQIKDALSKGVTDGLDLKDLADRVSAVFTDASENRALTIARTEVVSAYNGASQLAARALPDDVVAGQEWVATLDARTREDHADVEPAIVAVGDNWNVGGEMLAYPGDPAGSPGNVVNCRCTVAYLTPEEVADMGVELVAATDRGKPRMVTRSAADLILTLADAGSFDELAARRALQVAG